MGTVVWLLFPGLEFCVARNCPLKGSKMVFFSSFFYCISKLLMNRFTLFRLQDLASPVGVGVLTRRRCAWPRFTNPRRPRVGTVLTLARPSSLLVVFLTYGNCSINAISTSTVLNQPNRQQTESTVPLPSSSDLVIKPNAENKARQSPGLGAVEASNEGGERGSNTKRSLCNSPALIWW